MDLQYLDIVNGAIDLKIKDSLRMRFTGASVSIQSHAMLNSTKMEEIKKSLTSMSFDHGMIQSGALNVELKNFRYTRQSGRLSAGSIQVADKENRMNLSLEDADIKKLQVFEQTGHLVANGIKWQKGDVQINMAGSGNKTSTTFIELRNVKGLNTTVNATSGNKTFSAKLNSISFDSLVKKDDSKLVLDGLAVDGKQLKLNDNNLILSVADYHIADNKNSSLGHVIYQSGNAKMNATISAPSLTVTPHIQSLINGNIDLDDIHLSEPVINIHFAKKDTAMTGKQNGFPELNINAVKFTQPEINITQGK